jgi:hypothetical protein
MKRISCDLNFVIRYDDRKVGTLTFREHVTCLVEEAEANANKG